MAAQRMLLMAVGPLGTLRQRRRKHVYGTHTPLPGGLQSAGRTPAGGKDVTFGAWAFGSAKPATPGSVGPASGATSNQAVDAAAEGPARTQPAPSGAERLPCGLAMRLSLWRRTAICMVRTLMVLDRPPMPLLGIHPQNSVMNTQSCLGPVNAAHAVGPEVSLRDGMAQTPGAGRPPVTRPSPLGPGEPTQKCRVLPHWIWLRSQPQAEAAFHLLLVGLQQSPMDGWKHIMHHIVVQSPVNGLPKCANAQRGRFSP
jgi:hypothetical protein